MLTREDISSLIIIRIIEFLDLGGLKFDSRF